MVLLVMGVAGSGKTTIGTLLAESGGCRFLDADSLHSAANITKMSTGIPLTDNDRAPWLSAVRERIVDAASSQESLVVACSALKEAYRIFLARDVPVVWIYLKGRPDVFRARLQQRSGHFMSAELLNSQFDALEEPGDAIVVDAERRPQAIVDDILEQLRTRRWGRPATTSDDARLED
jgi:gluconokinase